MSIVNLVDKRVEQAERIAKRFTMEKSKWNKHMWDDRPEQFIVSRTKQGDCVAMNQYTGIRIGRVYEPSELFGDTFGRLFPKENNQDRLQLTRGYAKLLLKRLRAAAKALKTDRIAVIDFDTLTVCDLQGDFSDGVKFELFHIDQEFLKNFRVNAYFFIQCLSAVLTLSTSPTITIGKADDFYGDATHKPLTIDGDYGNVKTLLMPVRK